MPVYLESFKTVLQPTIASLQAACEAYAAEGGSANIFISDDGLQLLSATDRRGRFMCTGPGCCLVISPDNAWHNGCLEQ